MAMRHSHSAAALSLLAVLVAPTATAAPRPPMCDLVVDAAGDVAVEVAGTTVVPPVATGERGLDILRTRVTSDARTLSFSLTLDQASPPGPEMGRAYGFIFTVDEFRYVVSAAASAGDSAYEGLVFLAIHTASIGADRYPVAVRVDSASSMLSVKVPIDLLNRLSGERTRAGALLFDPHVIAERFLKARYPIPGNPPAAEASYSKGDEARSEVEYELGSTHCSQTTP